MKHLHLLRPSILFVVIAVAAAAVAAQRKPGDTPVDYSASVQIVGPMGAAATTLMIHINNYTTERDRTTLVTALRRNGYQAFLPAFRKAPIVGYVQIKDEKWDLRWAQQQTLDLGEVVTVAADRPMYFVGGGSVDAKPRTGYEMAVIRLEVDTIGMGKGTFAPAARVKPNADASGVDVDEYAGAPVKISTVTRIFR